MKLEDIETIEQTIDEARSVSDSAYVTDWADSISVFPGSRVNAKASSGDILGTYRM